MLETIFNVYYAYYALRYGLKYVVVPTYRYLTED